MTEAEWLVSKDPKPLFGLIEGRTSNRKFVLFAVACHYLPAAYDPDHREKLKPWHARFAAAIDFVDRRISLDDVRRQWLGERTQPERGREWARGWADPPFWDMEDPLEEDVASLVREVFGNPFRSISVDLSWRTTTAVSIARTMYESRDFSPMPLLADALQDAGCENEDILNHCRSGGPHVRGCWVVDLILGKE